MRTTRLFTLALLAMGLPAVQAEVIRLVDGTTVEGQLGEPTELVVRTATGDRKVAWALLPAEIRKLYWTQAVVAAGAVKTAANVTPSPNAVTDEVLVALANEVSLGTWEQVAGFGSFRDKPEKRGTGGLVVTKAFNALDENWVTVYSPRDQVGQAGNWDAQVARARTLLAQGPQFIQRRWLELFVKAGEAVARRDSGSFAASVRDLKGCPVSGVAVAAETPRNFFTAK